MTQAHIHLLFNHFPILGTLFGILILGYGTLRGNRQVQTTAYLLFILSALGGVIAYATGDGAEELVEDLAGVTHRALEDHEDSGKYALVASGILGLLSVAGAILGRIKSDYRSRMAIGIGLFSLLTLAIAARTGYLGGKIRHTELYAPQEAESEKP